MSSLFSSSTVIDSILFRDAFGTQAMRDVFSDRTLISRYIEVEVALARAQGRCGQDECFTFKERPDERSQVGVVPPRVPDFSQDTTPGYCL